MISGKYRHYKGDEYEIITVAKNRETSEEIVVYRALYGNKEIWARPLNNFTDTIEQDGKSVPRFEKINQLDAFLSISTEISVAIGTPDILVGEAKKFDSNAKIRFSTFHLEGEEARNKDIVPVIVATSAGLVGVLLAVSHLLKTYFRRPLRCEWEELEEIRENGEVLKDADGLPVWRIVKKHALLDLKQLNTKQDLDLSAGIDGIHFKLSVSEDSDQ